MLRGAFYPITGITFSCWVSLKSCYRNWTVCAFYINLWTVSIRSLSTDPVETLLSRAFKFLIMCKESSLLIKETEEWTKRSASQKMTFEEEVSKIFFVLHPTKTKSTQTNGSVFAEEIEQVKMTKYELELIKNVDSFLDGYGTHSSNFVTFDIKSPLAYFFCNPK